MTHVEIIDIEKLNRALDEIQNAIHGAEPVIRCKDCRHNLDGSCEWHYGTGYRWNVDDDDYCSCAERRNDETD